LDSRGNGSRSGEAARSGENIKYLDMTKENLKQCIISLYPGFETVWESKNNHHINDDGSFTYCGVFAAFSNYFREHIAEFSDEQLRTLFEHMETWQRSEVHVTPQQWIKGDVSDEIKLSNAACTCFLENIAGEGLTKTIKPYLRPKSLAYYANYDSEAR